MSFLGKLAEKIDLPVRNVTSVAFGGKNYNSLYVTTTSVELDQTGVVGDGADAGKVLEITNPRENSFKGFQEHFFHL
jgi:sugar lactone lactonase YvrE